MRRAGLCPTFALMRAQATFSSSPRRSLSPVILLFALIAGAAGCGAQHAEPSLAAGAREVSFPGDGLVLRGTLTLPRREVGERVPGIVLVHGSGPQSQDEVASGQLNMAFGFSLPVFEQLAAGLGDAGYAVLRYDKRTCGRFNQCADNDYPVPSAEVSVDDFAADAVLALAYLGAQEGVDPDRLVVLGHSQGGALVPRIMQEHAGLAAGVIVAGNHSPMDEILAAQLASTRDLLREAGAPEEQLAEQLAPLSAAVEGAAAIRAGTHDGSPVMGAPPSFWLAAFASDDEAPRIARHLSAPVLVLSGDYDWNVPPSETQAWGETLMAAPSNPGHEVAIIPCVTHALNCVGQPDYRAVTPADIGREIDAAVVERIVRFLRAITRR